MKIKVLLADGFEESEVVIVVDLLRRANYDVSLISITDRKEVVSSHNIKIVVESTFDVENFETGDALFIPGGGVGVENLSKSQKVLKIINEFYKKDKFVIAICAGPQVLELSGILNGKIVTSYPSTEGKLKSIKEYSTEKVVVDGKIITSRGFGTAIDLGLKLIEIFSGTSEKEKIKKAIVY